MRCGVRTMSPLTVLLLHLCAVYCDSHSLRYYHTAVSAPGSGLPVFSSVGYVDDREIVRYNADDGRYRPRVSWMEKVEPGYWEEETWNAELYEDRERSNVRTLMYRFNQTGGLHIVQHMYGCERRDDGSITGYDQYGYDGGEFMSLDTKTATYIPTVPQAQISTERLNNPEEPAGETQKNYLENECIEWLQKYMEYGREDLERRVRPKVKVSGQERDGTVILHCQAYGFLPRQVDVKWMKNGVDYVPTYKTTDVLPNPDGTYQIRVTAEVIPKDGDSYSCYVDHPSLGEPLTTVWGPIKPSYRIIPVIIAVGVILLLLLLLLLLVRIGGFLLHEKKRIRPALQKQQIHHPGYHHPYIEKATKA